MATTAGYKVIKDPRVNNIIINEEIMDKTLLGINKKIQGVLGRIQTMEEEIMVVRLGMINQEDKRDEVMNEEIIIEKNEAKKYTKTLLNHIQILPSPHCLTTKKIYAYNKQGVFLEEKTKEVISKNVNHNNNTFMAAFASLDEQIKTLTNQIINLQASFQKTQQSNIEEDKQTTKMIKYNDPVKTKTIRWSDIVSSEEELSEFETKSIEKFPSIQQSLAYPIFEHKKRRRAAEVPKNYEKDEEIKNLKVKLQQLQELRKEEKKRLAILTEEEKNLTLEELKKKWVQDALNKRFRPTEDRELTKEEKEMTVTALRRKFAEEAQQKWIQRQQAMGYKVIKCDICNQWQREGDQSHWCQRSGLQLGIPGKPAHEEVILSGGPTAVRLSKQKVVDIDEVNKQIDKLMKLKQGFSTLR